MRINQTGTSKYPTRVEQLESTGKATITRTQQGFNTN